MLSGSLGLDLFPWERDVLDAWGARDSLDHPAYSTCGLSVPRQNGKNACIEAYETYSVAVCGWHVLHTAHRVKTTKKSFNRLVRWFTDKHHPELSRLVQKIRYTNGEEAILLTNGGSIEFSARSRAGNRGFDDIQLVVFDEAQELTDDQLSAIMYTLSASSTGERQIVYTGTPPNATAPGTVFGKFRKQATSGAAKRACWMEWSVEKLPPRNVKFSDVLDDVYATNPSMGYVLDEDWTATEFSTSSITGFAVERLGWWADAMGESHALDGAKWDAARIEAIGDAYQLRTAFGVKFSPDGSAYALAGCKLDEDGNAAVEIVRYGDTASGTRELADFLAQRTGKASCVVVDGMAGASALCDNLAEMDVPRKYVIRPRTNDVISAANGLRDSLNTGVLAHTGQSVLDDSAKGCTTRQIGNRGGWGFGSTTEHDSTPIEAAALALWGARNTRRNPKRKQRLV
jgi:hypothetical protein